MYPETQQAGLTQQVPEIRTIPGPAGDFIFLKVGILLWKCEHVADLFFVCRIPKRLKSFQKIMERQGPNRLLS